MSEPLRVVLDTSVWIGIYLRVAIINPSQPYTAIFDAFIDYEFVPIYSAETRQELLEELLEDERVADFYQIDPVHARAFVDMIFYGDSEGGSGECVTISSSLSASSDPRDNKFVETAIAGQVDYLVRVDKDLREEKVHAILNANGVRAIFPEQFRRLLATRRQDMSQG